MKSGIIQLVKFLLMASALSSSALAQQAEAFLGSADRLVRKSWAAQGKDADQAVRAPQEQTLLINGNFEDGPEGAISGWSRAFYPDRAGIENCIARSGDRAKLGNGSLRVDTGPVLNEEVTLVFNGGVSQQATTLHGLGVALSGWVYIETGTAVRPINMRLRMFGADQDGKTAFLGDVLSITVLGKPGEWTPFKASGTIGEAAISSMDLHCSIHPDAVPTIQFLDELRLELLPTPALGMRLPRDALWRDESVLPVEIALGQEQAQAEAIAFRLLDEDGREIRHWEAGPVVGVIGLPMPETRLVEGRYVLRGDLRAGKEEPLASAEGQLYIVASPWEDAPESKGSTSVGTPEEGEVEGFEAMGTVAPTDAPDAVPDVPESTDAVEHAERQERGYAVFSRHYLDPVSRLGRPLPGEGGPVRLFASPGEYEPAKISVWAIRPQTKMRVTVSELRSEEGTIASGNVDVRVVRNIHGLPPFTERREAVDIPQGLTQTFWLTLHVPPKATPGFYRGDIRLTPEKGQPAELDLFVRVLPLHLPTPEKGYGFWWKMDGRWNGYYSKTREEALEQIRKQFILLREYGCNMVSCYGMPKMTKGEAGVFDLDFTQDHWGHDRFSLLDFVRLGRETGLFSEQHPIQYPGAESLHSHWIADFAELGIESTPFEDLYCDRCRRVDQWTHEQGFSLAFACVDEIGNSPERRDEARRFYRIAREAGVLTSVTDNSMHAGMHLMGQPVFDEIIAMRLYNFITPEMIAHARNSGDGLWLYNLGSGGWDPKVDRFVFGLFTERCGADGHSQWAFQWPSGNTDPYEAAAAGQPSGYHYALPAPDGPLPTLALEGVREGIDDARYLSLLRLRSPQSAAAHISDIEPLSTVISEYLESHSGTFLDVKRWQIARQAL